MTFLESVPKSVRIVRPARHREIYEHWGKRAVDLLLCALILPVVVPLTGIILMIGVACGSSGLFAHLRVGRRGRVFRCWKIRTMAKDADHDLRSALLHDPGLWQEWSRKRKLAKDPRVTRFGRMLRRTSLDELPQIWNVIVGDMSLVGPRPITRTELQFYGAAKAQYLSVRPGITGLWQITGRRSGCYVQRVRLDASYIETVSLRGDLAILVQTLPEVFRRSGT